MPENNNMARMLSGWPWATVGTGQRALLRRPVSLAGELAQDRQLAGQPAAAAARLSSTST